MRFRIGLAGLLAAAILAPAAGALPRQETAPAAAPALRYEIWVELDAAGKMLLGKEEIVWANTTRDAVPDMLLHLYWNAFKNEDSAFLSESRAGDIFGRGAAPDDGEWGWIDIADIRLADGSDLKPGLRFVTPDGPEHPGDQTVVRVLFPEPIQPGESVRLLVDFRNKVPRTVARSGYYKDSFFIAQWFPKPGVYEEGKGWNAHAYHQNSEFFADFADFAVHITVPQEYVIGATGRQTDVRVDGSAGKTTYTFRQAMVHDFAWMADPRYLKVEREFIADEEVTPEEYRETAELLGLPVGEVKLPDVKMTLLIAPEHRRQVERHFRALRAAIKYYGLWYGPYPYETVTMVDPPFRTGSGGMEYPTFFTAGTRVLTSRGILDPEGVIVHEFGHSYWYGLVATNEFEAAWLDEGFTTYSTGRVMAKAYGPGAMPVFLNGIPLDRVLRLPRNFDFELNRVAAINVARFDPVTAWSWKYYDSGSYGANVYMRAATLLSTLEGLLGERTWARIMRTYHMRYRYKHPGMADFVGVVNEVSGKDMAWFFDELFGSAKEFDYGVAAVSSVKVPRQRRGVYDVQGGREEMTSARLEAIEALVAGKSPEMRTDYKTTVVLRRYGEARVGGDTQVKVLVRFKDGTTETRAWDGQARWARLEFVKPVEVEGAQIDPENVWLIDANLANNSRGVDGLRRNVVKLMTQLLFTVQSFLQLVSSWS